MVALVAHERRRAVACAAFNCSAAVSVVVSRLVVSPTHSALDVRFLRRRSSRASASRVGVLRPEAVAGRVRTCW